MQRGYAEPLDRQAQRADLQLLRGNDPQLRNDSLLIPGEEGASTLKLHHSVNRVD